MECGPNFKFNRTYPQCFGRMVNLFEINIGASTNRRLTDKQHSDGSAVSRSRSDLSTSNLCVDLDRMDHEMFLSECKRTIPKHKSHGTPMKMLIAQEMSKEVDCGNSPLNLVAKLMGLDSLPHQQPGSVNQRSHLGHHRCHSEIPISNWERQSSSIPNYAEAHGYKDVHHMQNQSLKSSHKEGSDENDKQRDMPFAHQKFAEAKRPSMDEKLWQSKHFQDALEVLNLNTELFMKCLQKPNSLSSQQLYTLQSNPPPETKRITILRPSKLAESDLAVSGAEYAVLSSNDSPVHGHQLYENPSLPTRIVVLKPSRRTIHSDLAAGFPQSQSSWLHGEDPWNTEDRGCLESRAIAKAITETMCEKLRDRDGNVTSVSSAVSNGYVVNGSSFNKSESEFPAGILNDSEVMSPPSRHSWDYINGVGSPYASPYSRAPYSPDSSVCREAKKRLSERWAKMTSNGNFQGQKLVQKGCSTLGEMLALSEAKKTPMAIPGGKDNSVDDPSDLKSLFESESVGCSPQNLMRSKSVPVSSISCDNANNLEEESKSKISKPSFRQKVSSLFFSRNKRSCKDRTLVVEVSSDKTESCIEPMQDPGGHGLLKSSSTGVMPSKSPMTRHGTELSVPWPMSSENHCKNHEFPSPVSVLDPPFAEENGHISRIPGYLKLERRGLDLPLNFISSSIIEKSPPMGSIARTLSWGDTSRRGEPEEEWPVFLKALLSAAGMGEGALVGWHSSESPLDPSFRDKYIELNEKGMVVHDAKRRQKRSMQKLVFDCVNAALLDMAGTGRGVEESKKRISEKDVWEWMNALFSGSKWVRNEMVEKEWSDKVRLEIDCFGMEIEGKLMEELVEETVIQLF